MVTPGASVADGGANVVTGASGVVVSSLRRDRVCCSVVCGAS